MWYKCYSQSAGEGFGEMQEGYKESKNGLALAVTFMLLLLHYIALLHFLLSLAPYALSFVYTLSLFHISSLCRLFFLVPRAIKHSNTLTKEIIGALQPVNVLETPVLKTVKCQVDISGAIKLLLPKIETALHCLVWSPEKLCIKKVRRIFSLTLQG